jgi:hypothetical protein
LDFIFVDKQSAEIRGVHTASDIPISSYSRSRAYQQFIGVQQNTDVFFKLLKAVLKEKRRRLTQTWF